MRRSCGSRRREFLGAAAFVGAATLVAPYVRTAHAAGRLSLLLFDHWVPGVNEVMRRLIEAWGRANHVEVEVDFNNQNIHVMAAEARARTGHDVMWFMTWEAVPYEHSLEPVDDVVEAITQEYGPYTENVEYTGRLDGAWRAVPDVGAQSYPLCSRLDRWREHAGIDLKELFPAGPRAAAELADWTYPAFLAACKKLHAAGHPFGDPIAPSEDADQWLAPLFLSFGSRMVDERGELALDADETRAALEYLKELAQYMPTEVYAWDNAGNNRWLISGRGSASHNPPSAWAVAKRDAPEVAEQLWHHDVPSGPRGHFRGTMTRFWGIWEFSQKGGGQGPAPAPVAEGAGGRAASGRAGLRRPPPAGVPGPPDLGGVGPAGGDIVQLRDPRR